MTPQSFGSVRVITAWLAAHLPSRVVARIPVRDERGATAVEYGLMVALIAAVILVAVVYLGQTTEQRFECMAGAVQSHTSADC